MVTLNRLATIMSDGDTMKRQDPDLRAADQARSNTHRNAMTIVDLKKGEIKSTVFTHHLYTVCKVQAELLAELPY